MGLIMCVQLLGGHHPLTIWDSEERPKFGAI